MKKGFIGVFVILLVSLFLTSNTTVEAKKIDLSEEFATGINEFNSFTNVAIFIRFADETDYVAPFDLAHYENMFNGVDTISLRDYFLEVSYNQLTIDTYLVSGIDSILYYEDTHNRGYFMPYSAQNTIGYEDEDISEDREHRLLKDAADWVEDNNLIEDTVNLDVNNDGDIDSITFMVSGEDEGWYSLLWPHKWSINSYYNYSAGDYTYDAPTINGKHVWDYTFELLGDSSTYENIVDVGVLAHETFHLLSAPDLYHYFDYDWIEAVGQWGLMDGVDNVPSHMLGYMKYQYGNWINEVAEINTSGTYTLYPLQEAAENLFRIPLGYSNEYIYLEYRDNEGLYESTLTDSGLIVYRVDEDFINQGNESGYYDSGTTNEEVWVFRPGMDDVIDPIIFADIDPGYDVDGDLDEAAILNTNIYNEAGSGTDVLLFDSEGNEVIFRINNVIEYDGYITFDVLLTDTNPSIILNNPGYSLDDDVVLLDYEDTYYYLSVNDYYESDNYHYTLDGTTPTAESPFLISGEVEITAENNILTYARIVDGQLSDFYQKEFTFATDFETPHDGYGNDRESYWFLNYRDMTHFTFEFSNDSFTESTDYVSLIFPSGEVEVHSESTFEDISYDVYGTSFVLLFSTDYSLDEYYGFLATATTISTFDSSAYYIEEEVVYHQIEYDFENAVQFVTINNDVYHANMITELDTDVAGSYLVTYEILNATNDLIDTLTQTVHVGDYYSPEITLISGDVLQEAGTQWVDPGYTVFDLSTELEEMVLTGTVDPNTLGVYYVTYQISDLAGNISELVSRKVTVVDTTKPTVTLNPGIDTIVLGEEWIDGGIEAMDTFDTEVSMKTTNPIDNTTIGKYTIFYTVEDQSGNKTIVTRFVHVVEAPQHHNIMIDCDVILTTIEQGSSVSLPVCTYNDVQVEGTLQESTSSNGYFTYEVYYVVTIEEQAYIIRKFVFVVPVFNDYQVINHIENKRRDTL